MTVHVWAIRLATNSWPTLCITPPVAEIPMILTRFGPSNLTRSIENRLRNAPPKLYRNVDIVPPSNAVRISRNQVSVITSRKDNVKMATIVIKLANPNLAPGAKANGKGIIRSKIPMITP